MDKTNLRENYPKLITHIENEGYNVGYVSRIKRVVKDILDHDDSGGSSSYREVCLEYERKYVLMLS